MLIFSMIDCATRSRSKGSVWWPSISPVRSRCSRLMARYSKSQIDFCFSSHLRIGRGNVNFPARFFNSISQTLAWLTTSEFSGLSISALHVSESFAGSCVSQMSEQVSSRTLTQNPTSSSLHHSGQRMHHPCNRFGGR